MLRSHLEQLRLPLRSFEVEFGPSQFEITLDAMRALAAPVPGDPAIVAGETGASGLAALLAADGHDEIRRTLDLGAQSRVLLIGSEGDTDPQIYRQIVGSAAAAATVGAP